MSDPCVVLLAILVAAAVGSAGAADGQPPKAAGDAAKPGEAPAKEPSKPAPADTSSPQATARTLWAAAKAGDAKAVAACFCEANQAPLAENRKIVAEMEKLAPGRGERLDVVQAIILDAKAAGPVECRGEKTDGDKGTCEIRYTVTRDDQPHEHTRTLSFVREKGAWKIAFPVPEPAETRKKLEILKEILR